MNISNFIKENDSSYDTSLDEKINNIHQLVSKNLISKAFATFLISYFIKKEVNKTLKSNLDNILGPNENKGDKWLLINYRKMKASYT